MFPLFFAIKKILVFIFFLQAIKRLQKRNDLTEAEAAARIRAQPSNEEHVRLATVVLCTLWSYDFTQKQVAQAWIDLQKYLKLRAGKL